MLQSGKISTYIYVLMLADKQTLIRTAEIFKAPTSSVTPSPTAGNRTRAARPPDCRPKEPS